MEKSALSFLLVSSDASDVLVFAFTLKDPKQAPDPRRSVGLDRIAGKVGEKKGVRRPP